MMLQNAPQSPSAAERSASHSTMPSSPPKASNSKTIDLQAETQPLLAGNAQEKPSQHQQVAVTGCIVAAWFSSNIGLLLMNKFLLSNYGFKQPVFLTVCHMFACVVLSSAVSTTSYVPKRSINSSQQMLKIAVLATVFALSVVLGNVSLNFIPVSFSQVTCQKLLISHDSAGAIGSDMCIIILIMRTCYACTVAALAAHNLATSSSTPALLLSCSI